MINMTNVGLNNISNQQLRQMKPVSTPLATQENNVIPFKGTKVSSDKLVGALQGLYGIKPSKTVSFGVALKDALEQVKTSVVTCSDPENGRKGEAVGSRYDVSEIIDKLDESLPQYEDAVKTNTIIAQKDGMITESRTQIKNQGDVLLYEMAVRQPRPEGTQADRTKPLKQLIDIKLTPDSSLPEKMQERAYILNTKGNLMTVLEDNSGKKVTDRFVLLTDTGNIEKKDTTNGEIDIHTEKGENKYTPFIAEAQEVRERHPEVSDGIGTEIVIGMEDGRFVKEIIKSIADFEEKINNGEIVLDTFHAKPNANKIQLAMLAGGFGSRAEYTNATSDGIFHGKSHGAQSTKGVFRTPTGLTPMETTFITLHNAGLLDCSKGAFGIGKNVKFYLNKSGINKGNGGFTVDLYDKMERDGRDSLMIFPNDAMSRVTNGIIKAAEITNSGDAAMVMIAKEIDPKDASAFGIMKLGENNEIKAFVEKPKKVDDSLIFNGKCVANTFQFTVSKEAFSALDTLKEFFPAGKGKEPRDWSKNFTPILMTLTQKDDIDEIRTSIAHIMDMDEKDLPVDAIKTAKEILGDQKIIAVPTPEPWADCGTLNALYHTTMQIASGDFKLEDFERAHVLDCVNTQTGLVTTTPELKAKVEDKYTIDGEVMVAPQAQKVDNDILKKYKNDITINPRTIR